MASHASSTAAVEDQDSTMSSHEHEETPLLADSRRDSESGGSGGDGPAAPPPLRRIPDTLPLAAWLITAVEACERFAYYGVNAPLQNYIQNSSGDPFRPGALGLGQANATRLNLGFLFWSYVTPFVGAVLGDQYWGRYATIAASSLVYIAGLCVLVFSSVIVVPEDTSSALLALIVGMIFVGLGTGGIKTNVSPWLAEQYQERKEPLVLKSGEKVIADYNMTIQRIFMFLYMILNIGALSSIVTTSVEHSRGFTLAFLIPLLVFLIGLGILTLFRDKFIRTSPSGSTIAKASKVLGIAMRNGFSLEASKPSRRDESTHETRSTCDWDDDFVDDLCRAIGALRVFAFYPFFWLSWTQTLTNLVSQAGTMETHGIPNDLLVYLNSITVLCAVPLLDLVVFKYLRKRGINLGPEMRITIGFLFLAAAMAYSAVVQAAIYRAPPCYGHPLQCQDGKTPNHVHVLIQVPAYVLTGFSEIFTASTGLEYAFKQAPVSMRSLVTAAYHFSVAIGAIMGIAITPLARDPLLTWMYSGLSLMCIFCSGIFWLTHGRKTVPSDE